ncbi:ABC transporter permease [Actinomadura roseirufa]|uniref:ABC transporter permease n=1 Tax=Actinomadura roseirufa TaxID=2094049 RepID=UPI001040F05A|nr:ABC transporter permease [Actinomadura roseirufa]
MIEKVRTFRPAGTATAAGGPGKDDGGRAGEARFRPRAIPGGSAVVVFFVLVVAAFTVSVDGFATYSNVTVIASSSMVIMVASLGQLLAVISGGFDLSIGGVLPLAAVTFAVLTHDGTGFVPAVLLAMLVGLATGVVNGVVIGVFRINALIATLASLSITGGMAYAVSHGLTVQVAAEAGRLGDPLWLDLPAFVWLGLVLIVLAHLVLRYTIFGRRIYMIGGNGQAALLAGVRVGLVTVAVYGVSGVLAALAGVMAASQLLAATGGIGADTTLTSLTAVVLGGAALTGGRGGVFGAVTGVALLGVLDNALNLQRVPSFYQQIVVGSVLLLAVGAGRLGDLSPTRRIRSVTQRETPREAE